MTGFINTQDQRLGPTYNRLIDKFNLKSPSDLVTISVRDMASDMHEFATESTIDINAEIVIANHKNPFLISKGPSTCNVTLDAFYMGEMSFINRLKVLLKVWKSLS